MKKNLSFFFVLLIIFAACKKNISQSNDNNNPPPAVRDTVYAPITSYEGKVPGIYIHTLGNTIVNDPKVKSQIILQLGDTIPLKTTIGIEYRGSTSYYLFDQKSFGFEFWDNTGNSIDSTIMDLPKGDDFILYAPANDKSLLRNVLTYDLANQIGMYATKTRFVQLYLNGSYNGLYVLMEKIKRNKNRVNISKISDSDPSGGYILKIDKSTGDGPTGSTDSYYDASISFRSNFDTAGNTLRFSPFGSKRGEETYFLYEYPKAKDITTAQKTYIQKYIGDFESALTSTNYQDATTGYKKFIDVNSFADFFLLNELSHNPDGYRLSTFMYKDKGGTLKMGPVWDFNLAYGNDSRTPISATYNWAFHFNNYYNNDQWLINFWWKRLLSDPSFKTVVKQRWAQFRTHQFSDANIAATINKYVTLLQNNNSISKHFDRWKILGVRLPFNGFVGNTYEEELDYLKNWLKARTVWIDQNISSL